VRMCKCAHCIVIVIVTKIANTCHVCSNTYNRAHTRYCTRAPYVFGIPVDIDMAFRKQKIFENCGNHKNPKREFFCYPSDGILWYHGHYYYGCHPGCWSQY
jgi:hypothetical protein